MRLVTVMPSAWGLAAVPLVVAAAFPQVSAEAPAPPGSDEPFVLDRGPELPELRLPRGEELVFDVRLDVGVDLDLGKATMRTSVEPYREQILLNREGREPAQPGSENPARETGRMSIHAVGEYAFYEMDALIETLAFPLDQAWPGLEYRYTHRGTENRRREIRIGVKDGSHLASYRGDTRRGAPKGMRIWKDWKDRAVPAGTVDMLTAVYLARTMITQGRSELAFPLIDKLSLWQVHLRRGGRRKLETRAGTFDVVQVVLVPSPFPDEEVDEEKADRFEGLFGLHGSIRLYVDHLTGVPVRIQGDIPFWRMTFEIDVELVSYRGTPPEFQPVAEGKKS